MTIQQAAEQFPGCIRTFTGRYVDPFDPKPDDIVIEDIAHALSNLCRFGGHTKRFYSVAEHSVLCAMLVPGEHKLAALLHDASEAYLVDIPTPIKNRLPGYVKAEDRLMKVIADKFGFQYPFSAEVKEADRGALALEWKHRVFRVGLDGATPEEAEDVFLKNYYSLTK